MSHFEPLPRIFARLAYNIEVNRAINVIAIPLAAADVEQISDFYYVPMMSLQSSSGLSRDFAEDHGTESVPVSVVRLDTLLNTMRLGRVDLVKLDTEGTEPAALRGMGDMLGRCRPHILCEVLSSTSTGADIEQILAPHGYRFFQLTPQGPVESDTIIAKSGARNYLMISRDVDATVAAASDAYPAHAGLGSGS